MNSRYLLTLVTLTMSLGGRTPTVEATRTMSAPSRVGSRSAYWSATALTVNNSHRAHVACNHRTQCKHVSFNFLILYY